MYDRGEKEEKRANQLGEMIQILNGSVEVEVVEIASIDDKAKDPGELSVLDSIYIRHQLKI
jgi:hypothetical protein